MKRSIRIPYQERLLFCFLGGVIVGTVIANLLSSELRSQVGYFDALFLSGGVLNAAERKRLWIYVLRQRLLEVTGAWLVSLTTFASAGFQCLIALAGAGVGITVSVITLQKGMLGLPFYLATILPQWLFYIPVWLVLARWAGEDSRFIRWKAMVVLLALILLGTMSEVAINPFLTGIFRKI